MDRDELLAELAQVSREGASRALMLHQAVADRFGLGPSDIKCRGRRYTTWLTTSSPTR